MNRIWVALLLAVCVSVGEAWACGPEWTYIGRPPDEVVCVEVVGSQNALILAGMWRGPNEPQGGGIYAYSGHDTTWDYMDLRGQRIWQMRRFDYVPGSVFACADTGLYVSHNDGYDWTLLSRIGAGSVSDRHQEDFAISPFDTNQWVISSNREGAGGFYLSRDHGTSWELYFGGYVLGDLAFSNQIASTLYFMEGGPLERASFADSTFTIAMNLPNLETVMSIAPHPTQPWIYVLGESIGLYRYDEVNGDTLSLALPPGFSRPRTARFADGRGVLVSTDQDLLLASEDLLSWQSVGDGLPQPRGCDLFTAANRTWVIALVSGLYCRVEPLAASPSRQAPKISSVNLYPNPFNPTTQIGFEVPRTAQVKLQVYDIEGRLVQTLASRMFEAGNHTLTFDGSGHASGMYVVRMTSNKFSSAQKMMLLK